VREGDSVIKFFRIRSKGFATFMCADEQIKQIGRDHSQPRQSGCLSIVAARPGVVLVREMQSIACE
jgi:hypothetical protein